MSEQERFFVPAPTPASARTVEGLPAVQRVLGLMCGMVASMPLIAVEGATVLDTPAVLERPDPTRSRAWWVGRMVHDWWLHGNAVCYVTGVDPASGLPAAVVWLPAERVMVGQDLPRGPVRYWFDGVELLPEFVLHTRRGADPQATWRGVGVVEEAMPAWARISDQEAYQASTTSGSGVPSVVITAPNGDLSQEEADRAKKSWIEKLGGARRVPVVLPNGTKVETLAWSPADAQLNEARNLSLVDVANLANLDGYWLGASTGGLTYKSGASVNMYLHLLRQTLGPIISAFEGDWSSRLTAPGIGVKFDTQGVLGDDMGTTIGWGAEALGAGILTVDEVRAYLGKSPAGAR